MYIYIYIYIIFTWCPNNKYPNKNLVSIARRRLHLPSGTAPDGTCCGDTVADEVGGHCHRGGPAEDGFGAKITDHLESDDFLGWKPLV